MYLSLAADMADLLVHPVDDHQLVVLPDPTVAQSLVLAIVENDFQKIISLPFFLITITFSNNPPPRLQIFFK
jgi:hypothetical protein